MKRNSTEFWQQQRMFLPSVLILTHWRWRQQWLLLLVTGLGVLSAITLIAALPLFSSLMTTAGLRTTLRTTPNAGSITTTASLWALSSANLTEALSQIDTQAQQDLGSYANHQQASDVQVRLNGWSLQHSTKTMNLTGLQMSEARSHVQLLQGRLPVDTGAKLEGMITPSTAAELKVTVGSTLNLEMTVYGDARQSDQRPSFPAVFQVTIAGIFQTQSADAYWYGYDFTSAVSSGVNNGPFDVLVSRPVLLHALDTTARKMTSQSVFFRSLCLVSLTYTLDITQMRGEEIDDLNQSLGTFQADAAQLGLSSNDYLISFPFLATVTLSSPILPGDGNAGLLAQYTNQVALSATSLIFLTLQIVGLLLFFISVSASLLLEHQEGEIALLRSRGASSLQIVCSLLVQCLPLCLLAGLLGPLLALGAISLLARPFLTNLDRDVLNTLPQNLPQLASSVGFYVLGAVLLTLATLLGVLVLALRRNTLTQRQEAARSKRHPLWLRLRLDLVLSILALACYAYTFLAQNVQQLVDVQTQELLLTPLGLLAPFLLLLAGLLFFVRMFPLLLRVLTRLSLGGRGLSSPLVLSQMERAPRQPMRMTLLLGLATAFLLFTLIFSATQTQHTQDLASYETGADFSGYLSLTVQASADHSPAMLMQESQLYQHFAGVTSASVGHVEQSFLPTSGSASDQQARPLQLRAVDPRTFAQTAYWTEQESSASLPDLLAQLVAQRPQALARGVVPAFVTSSAWQALHLQTGATFHLLSPSKDPDQVTYLALGEIAHIPPANESMESGMLVDFFTLVQARVAQKEPVSLNYLWLRTSDSPATLARLRHMLNSQPLGLDQLSDRRAIAAVDETDPLILNIFGILSGGVITAFLLALLANLLLPVLGLRARLTRFALLRALGATPRQIARVLIWEQGIVWVASLVLGLGFGLLFAFVTIPSLVFTSTPAGSVTLDGSTSVYLLQRLLPTRVVLPFSLILALAALALLGALALGLMLRLTLQSALSQTLRINED